MTIELLPCPFCGRSAELNKSLWLEAEQVILSRVLTPEQQAAYHVLIAAVRIMQRHGGINNASQGDLDRWSIVEKALQEVEEAEKP